MAGPFAARQKAVSRVPSYTQPKAARIWDRSPFNGPWCVAELRGSLRIGGYAMTNRERLTRLRGMQLMQCSAPATIEVNGQNYCERHAGEIALAALLGE